jgi:8-oxo-dGTP pyrophosphatase MutT (NUDIX family)
MRREFSAGGVVYKKVKGKSSKVKLLWLVAKSKHSKEYPDDVWRLPKAWLDDEMGGKKPGQLARGSKRANAEQVIKAAVREVVEEGGVEVKVIRKIATDNYFYLKKGKDLPSQTRWMKPIQIVRAIARTKRDRGPQALPVGIYTDKEKSKVAKFVTYFLMEWQRDLEEGFGEETEEVKWLEYKKARERLTYPREKKILEKAKKIIDNLLL